MPIHDPALPLPRAGGLTVFRISISKLGDVLLFHTHLPTAPLAQTVKFRWYADRKLPRALVGYVVGPILAWALSDAVSSEHKECPTIFY